MARARMDDQRFEQRLAAILEDEDRARAFRDLARLYFEAEEDQRERLRSGWDFGKKWRPPIQEDLARRLPGAPPERRIREALAFESIRGAQVDERDTLVSLAVIYHAAVAAGLDAMRLFDEVAAMFAEPVAGVLRSFPRRREADRSLEAFHLRVVETPEGPRVELDPTWWR